jgi:hypothetical protein
MGRGGGIAPSFLTSALDGGEWSASRSCRFTPQEKSPRYPLDRRLGRPQSRSGCYGEKIFNSQISEQQRNRGGKVRRAVAKDEGAYFQLSLNPYDLWGEKVHWPQNVLRFCLELSSEKKKKFSFQ